MNSFVKTIATNFDFSPSGIRGHLVPKRHRLLRCINDRPDILADPGPSDQPGFVQQAYLSGGVHLANEMYTSCGNRQWLRYQAPQRRRQLHYRRAAPHLGRRLAGQAGWTIAMVIPAAEGWR